MVRIFGNAVGWPANAAKLSSVGLWLNASKSESMLECDDIHLDWCFSTNSLWSTRYFKVLPNVGRVKSSVDDLIGTWYCKHESSLCATICWGSASVPRFVRWHVNWSVAISCLPVVALSPPTLHLAAHNKQPPPHACKASTIEPHIQPPGGEKRSTYLRGYVPNWLPENNIRVTTTHNNQSLDQLDQLDHQVQNLREQCAISTCIFLEKCVRRISHEWATFCTKRCRKPSQFSFFLFFLLPKLSPFRMQQNPKPNSNTQQSIYFSPSSVSIFHPTTSPSMPCPSSFPYHFPPPITYTGNISTRACAADKQYTIVHVHTQTIRMGKLFKNSLFPGTPGKWRKTIPRGVNCRISDVFHSDLCL